MQLARFGRVLQHRDQQVAQALPADFGWPARAGFAGQRVDAAAVKHLNPEPNEPVTPVVEPADLGPRHAHEQGADGGQAHVAQVCWGRLPWPLLMLQALRSPHSG